MLVGQNVKKEEQTQSVIAIGKWSTLNEETEKGRKKSQLTHIIQNGMVWPLHKLPLYTRANLLQHIEHGDNFLDIRILIEIVRFPCREQKKHKRVVRWGEEKSALVRH